VPIVYDDLRLDDIVVQPKEFLKGFVMIGYPNNEEEA